MKKSIQDHHQHQYQQFKYLHKTTAKLEQTYRLSHTSTSILLYRNQNQIGTECTLSSFSSLVP